MKFCQKLTKLFKALDKRVRNTNERGVALFIVLTAMATLAIFLGEITYTAQINQKLAYDRLDQVKATALAKSGFRLALLRIRAYSELKKTVGDLAKKAGANASAVDAVVPKEMIEKIWNEPITIPFTGDISSLPTAAQDALGKFRKDSSLEGKLYLSILSQSAKFNLNSYLPSFVSASAPPATTPTPGSGGAPPPPSPTPSGTPIVFNAEKARELLTQQITQTFQNRFDTDEKFRDQYRNLKISDLADDIMSWNDITYDNNRAQSTNIQYKKAPFYDISELHYLPTVDDEIYDLLAPAYSATVQSNININKIQEATLIALVPLMTADERKKFFEDRDQAGITTGTPAPGSPNSASSTSDANGPFKDPADFFTYLKSKSVAYNTDQKITDFKNNLTQRGINIIVEESQFLVHIEATVQQTKRTLEAVVMIVPPSTPPGGGAPGTNPAPTPPPTNNSSTPTVEKSNLKVLQMRFL